MSYIHESIYVGYRYFDSLNLKVRYPFGFGLSYTTYAYDNLELKYEFIDGQIIYTPLFDVTNTGKVAAPKSPNYTSQAKPQAFINQPTNYADLLSKIKTS
jgi:beta-glucosidase